MLPKLLCFLRSACVCLFLLFVPAAFAQTTIHVGSGQPYTTIQSGIDAANNGDTVLVAPGTYIENIDFKGKAITVTGQNSSGATVTIDGGRKAATVVFTHGESRASTLSNVTVTGGQGTYSTPLGGIYILNSSPTITNNIITANQCYGINSQSSAPLIANNEISYTQAVPFECFGAAGSGIFLNLNRTIASLPPVVFENTIEYNTQSGFDGTSGNGGAGISVYQGNPIIASNVIRYNATGKNPSSIGGGVGGGMRISIASGIIVNNLIYGNTASLGGGGVYLESENIGASATLFFINNTIVDNAVVPVSTSSQIIVGGEQIYYENGSFSVWTLDLRFLNNIIGGATANPSIVCYDGTVSPPSYSHNDFYNTAGSVTGTYNSLTRNPSTCIFPAGTNGNLSTDPRFLSSSTQNYHVPSTSPTVDTGDNTSVALAASLGGIESNDLEGNARIQNALGKSCTIDMGAYEYGNSSVGCGILETLTSSLNPAAFGQSVTFTAQLTASTGAPTGSIQFLDGTTTLSTQPVSTSGFSSFTTTALAVGSHPITANYQPTGAFSSATASLTQVITGTQTSLALTCQPPTISIAGTALLTATVTSAAGTPTGTIAFTDNASPLATQTLLNGTASLTYTGTAAQTHTITATYTPTGAFSASSASCSEVVTPLPTTSVLAAPSTLPSGTAAILSATITSPSTASTAVPTGTVAFFNGTTLLATGVVGNTGTSGPGAAMSSVLVPTLPVGTLQLTCLYSGDSIYASSSCNPVSVTVTGTPTSLTLSSSPNPANALTPVTFTAHLIAGSQPAAGSPIILTFSSTTAAPFTQTVMTDATGTATFTTSALTPGTYLAAATFSATNSLQGSSASHTEVVVANTTATTLAVSPNPANQKTAVTLTAFVAATSGGLGSSSPPIPSGTVTFSEGSTLLATIALDPNGHASFTSSTFSVGTHLLTATYNGTTSFTASTSTSITLVVNQQDFLLVTIPTLTIQTEHHHDLDITLTSIGNFADTVQLTCGDLPEYTTCTFNGDHNFTSHAAALTLAAGVTVTTTVHVDTDQVYGYKSELAPPPNHSRRWPTGIALALLFPVTLLASKRRRLPLTLALILLSFGLLSSTGCSSLYPKATPPGTYNITVTGVGQTTHLGHTAQTILTVTQ